MEFVSICQTSPLGMSEIMSNRFTLEIPSPTPVSIVSVPSEHITPSRITRINVKRKMPAFKTKAEMLKYNVKQTAF